MICIGCSERVIFDSRHASKKKKKKKKDKSSNEMSYTIRRKPLTSAFHEIAEEMELTLCKIQTYSYLEFCGFRLSRTLQRKASIAMPPPFTLFVKGSGWLVLIS